MIVAAQHWGKILHFNVWGVLFFLNVLAILAIIGYVVWTIAHTPHEERPAPNATPFLADEDLEGRRLDRVLGWALFFAAITAIALPLYWLHETAREKASVKYFDSRAVERGDVLFSNKSMPKYDGATSLQCANCHGTKGEGGAAQTVYKDAQGNAYSVSWKAPALNTVLYRFSEQEVHDIITYGRQGTPMQPWGIAGGGPKNEQSVADLVSFIKSIQLSPAKAKAQISDALKTWRAEPAKQLKDAQDALAKAKSDLADAQTEYDKNKDDPKYDQIKLRDLKRTIDEGPTTISNAQLAVDSAKSWVDRRKGVSDGQLLFELNCARCHTKNWSVFDPTQFAPENLLGLPGGGGSLGFNLRDGQMQRRFPDTTGSGSGWSTQVDFVTNGSEANKSYGSGGIGSGRMPGFLGLLTSEQIDAIVTYERCGLDATSTDLGAAGYDTTAKC